jgi:hypothetical protein
VTSADLLTYVLALVAAAACRGATFSGGADLRRSAERWNGWGTFGTGARLPTSGSLSRKEAIVWALNALALAALVAIGAAPSLAENGAFARAAIWMTTGVATAPAAGFLLRASFIWRRHRSVRWIGVLPLTAGVLFIGGLSILRAFGAARVQPPHYGVDALWYAGSLLFLVVLPVLDARLDRKWSSRLFAYAVPRELSVLCGGALLPFAAAFVPAVVARPLLGLGLFALAATAWRPGQISRLGFLPFVVIAAHAAGRSVAVGPHAESTMLASGHLVIALVYLVYAAGALERTRAYTRTGQAPLHERLAAAPSFDVGGVKISVMPGSTPDTEGTTVRVHGIVGGTDAELLRFDCLEVDAHFHYDPDGRDVQHPIVARDAGEAIESALARLEHELPGMLADAGYETLARRIDEQRLREQIPAIRAAMHAARR